MLHSETGFLQGTNALTQCVGMVDCTMFTGSKEAAAEASESTG